MLSSVVVPVWVQMEAPESSSAEFTFMVLRTIRAWPS
jgi:hypothetical protein